MDINTIVTRCIQRVLTTIRQPFRAKLARITSKGGVMTAQLDGLAPETLQTLEVFQHYGITSVPPEGAMAIVIPVGGKTSHGIVMATEHSAYRMQALASGEVAIYTDEGASIVLKKGKIIQATCDDFQLDCKTCTIKARKSATVDTPQLTATQNTTVKGLLTGSGGMSLSGDNGSGAAASFAGNINHTSGTIASVSVKINGIEVDGHKHTTPDGDSGPMKAA